MAVAAVDAGAVADAGPVVSRVACVTPELTELVDAMGLGDHIVGVSGLEAPGGTARPRVGPMVNPDVDVILAQRAEAVLTLDGPFSGAAAARLRAAGVTIRVLHTENLAETMAAATSIGRWLGRSDAAEAYRARVQSALAAATARTASRRERPRVLGLVMRQPIVVVEGQGTWFDDLVRASGGTVPVSSTNRHPIATPDQIAQWAPDVIVDFTDGSEADLRAMFEHPDAVPALRDHRVVAQHDRLLLQHGGQVTEALQRMQSVVR
ncbi:MAG: helical backbone metal receptor [Polyangiales bacterium]